MPDLLPGEGVAAFGGRKGWLHLVGEGHRSYCQRRGGLLFRRLPTFKIGLVFLALYGLVSTV